MSASHNDEQLVARPPIHPASFESLQPDRRDDIFLYREDDNINYRYKLIVVDRSILPTTRLSYATAAFLVPAGRESEYMFTSAQGLRSIAASAQTARLIVVSFGRKHSFSSQQAVQQELTFVVQILAKQGTFLPKSNRLSNSQEIPFMAMDGIGKRNIIAEGESSMSGKYLVEQLEVEGQKVRRLYFLDNPFVIQSEVVLAEDGLTVDKSQASFLYHKARTSNPTIDALVWMLEILFGMLLMLLCLLL